MNTLIFEEHESHAQLQLNRPEHRNVISLEMVEELHAVCAELELNPRTLIIKGVLSESGPIFAAGVDIAQLRERRNVDALRGINSGIFRRITALPMPVIAAVDGYAIGGGAELAFAADFRLATPRSKLGNPETGLGIAAAAGGMWRLLELVGEPIAKEILLAGRMLTAQEAFEIHLFNSLHEPEQLIPAAVELADKIGKLDPLATQLTKKVMHAPRSAHPLVDELAQAVLFESPEKFARMDAFLNRNKNK